MLTRWGWYLRRLTRQLWVRIALMSLLAVGSAFLGYFAAPYIPEELAGVIGADSADNILSIIASSMLAVTTFSLSTMVQAYSSATANVTPRATQLMIEDSTSQNVLATFMGSFLFSLVALITLTTGAYGDRGRVVLFIVTIGVVILIVFTLLRWIDYLRKLGRLGETAEQLEKAASGAINDRLEAPYLGGQRLDPDNMPKGLVPVFASQIGYIQHIAMEHLQACSTKAEIDIHVLTLTGTFIDAMRPVAMIPAAHDDLHDDIASAFSIGNQRTFDQDPRFGVMVLSEIAQKGLSSAINDIGTAIDIIGRGVRILTLWNTKSEAVEVTYPNVYVPEIKLGDLFDDFFAPIARDGAGLVEIQVRLQKALRALSALEDPRFAQEAARLARLAKAHAKLGLKLDEEYAQVEKISAWISA